MYLTHEDVIQACKRNPRFRRYVYCLVNPELEGMYYILNSTCQCAKCVGARESATKKFSLIKVDENLADQFLSAVKKRQLDGLLGKDTRPWEVVDVTKSLDNSQPWIGIEYETGYSSKTAYRKVLNFVWNNVHRSTIDYEGCGNFPCEITYPPVNMADFLSDDYYMDRLLTFMIAAKCRQHRYDSGETGIHVNFSTPSYRQLDARRAEKIVNVLAVSADNLSHQEHVSLWRRYPYGLFYSRGIGSKKFIEGKLFDTTDDLQVWQAYKYTMKRLADLTEYLSANYSDIMVGYKRNRFCVENFYQILTGTETEAILTILDAEKDVWSW